MRVFTTSEIAAELFSTSTQTIRNWVAEGSLTAAPRRDSRREVLRITVASLATRAGMSVAEVTAFIDAVEAREKAARRANKPEALHA